MSAFEPTKLQKLFFAELNEVRDWKLEDREEFAPIKEAMEQFHAASINWPQDRKFRTEHELIYQKAQITMVDKIEKFLKNWDDDELVPKLCRWYIVKDDQVLYEELMQCCHEGQFSWEEFGELSEDILMNWKAEKDSYSEYTTIKAITNKLFANKNHNAPDAMEGSEKEKIFGAVAEIFILSHPNKPADKKEFTVAKKELTEVIQRCCGVGEKSARFLAQEVASEAHKAMQKHALYPVPKAFQPLLR